MNLWSTIHEMSIEYQGNVIRQIRNGVVSPEDAVIDLQDGTQLDLHIGANGQVIVQHLSKEEVAQIRRDTRLISRMSSSSKK